MKNELSQSISGFRKLIVVASVLMPGLLSMSSASAALLLEVDLSVENTISISATDGASLVSATGQDFIGIYLENFYGTNNFGFIDDVLISGDLTSANQASDLSPNLFHFSNDPGLNIFDVTNANNLTFTEGLTAFTGSATWTIGSVLYQHFLANATSGDIFFAADSVGDLNNASVLGSWEVVGVPEPSILVLFSLGLACVGFARIKLT